MAVPVKKSVQEGHPHGYNSVKGNHAVMQTKLPLQATTRAAVRRRDRWLAAVLWLGLVTLLFALSR